MRDKQRVVIGTIGILLLALSAGCKKKVPVAAVPPPAPPPARAEVAAPPKAPTIAEFTESIGVLSGGQFQRLLVAFALLGKPSVLLLDEPTAGVDGPGQKRLNALVRHLQEEQGLSVLFISHDLSVVYQYAINVLCLGGGHAHLGPPRKILTPDLLSEIYGSTVDYHVHEH